jgi:hypothetical protein
MTFTKRSLDKMAKNPRLPRCEYHERVAFAAGLDWTQMRSASS